jgi:hypothetical protein
VDIISTALDDLDGCGRWRVSGGSSYKTLPQFATSEV